MKKFIKLSADYFNTDLIKRIGPSYSCREVYENGSFKTTGEYYPSVVIFYKDDDGPGKVIGVDKTIFAESALAVKKADLILKQQLKQLS